MARTEVTAYISKQPKHAQKMLKEMRACLKKAAPKAIENIKWGTPSFSYKRILFNYAAFKDHVSLFPTPSAIAAFKKELAPYTVSRGTIQFPYDKKLPLGLIRKIALFRVKEMKEKDARWM